MRILHVIPSLSPLRGGPSSALSIMAQSLAHCNVEVHIAATDDNGPARLPVPLGQPVVRDAVTTWYFPRQTRFYTFSWPLTHWLARHTREYDVVHIHALFSYAAAPASWAATHHGVPYVVRPLGTLSQWSMSRRRPLLKQLSFRLLERRIVNGAAAVHYTSQEERLEAEALGIRSPAAVIPLGLDHREFEQPVPPARFLRAYPSLAGRTIVLFLSRLDPKKGLDILLPAFAQVHQTHPETALALAGDGEEGYVADLRASVHRLGLEASVVFTGFLHTQEKLSALSAATVFVLPSYSENFGVAPVEAMATGVPVVLSEHVGISVQVQQSEAGLIVPTHSELLADALDRVVSDSLLRQRLGENAKRLARTRFSAELTARELRSLYERILVRHADHDA